MTQRTYYLPNVDSKYVIFQNLPFTFYVTFLSTIIFQCRSPNIGTGTETKPSLIEYGPKLYEMGVENVHYFWIDTRYEG